MFWEIFLWGQHTKSAFQISWVPNNNAPMSAGGSHRKDVMSLIIYYKQKGWHIRSQTQDKSLRCLFKISKGAWPPQQPCVPTSYSVHLACSTSYPKLLCSRGWAILSPAKLPYIILAFGPLSPFDPPFILQACLVFWLSPPRSLHMSLLRIMFTLDSPSILCL